MGVYFSYFSLAVTLAFLPMVYLWVVMRPCHELENLAFKERWGSFYAESRMTSRWNLFYNFVSLARRFQLIFFVIYVPQPAFQVLSILISNTLVMSYQLTNKPLKSPSANFVESFNEYMIFLLTVLLLCYTEIVGTNQAKYDMGFVQIYVLGIYIVINVLFLAF